MKWYSRHAGPELKRVLEEFASSSSDERFSLASEIDLARVNCQRAVELYELAHFSKTEVSENTKSMASAVLRDALNTVTDTVSKGARARSLVVGTIAVDDIQWVVRQITIRIEQILIEGHGLHDEASELIESFKTIELPTIDAAGGDPNKIAADLRDTVRAMRATMPAANGND